MKKHLLVLLLGLIITHGSVWAWSYFIEVANARWYAFPVTMLAINVFLVGCAIAMAGGEAVKDALKSSGKDSALAALKERIAEIKERTEGVARLNSELDLLKKV